MSNKSELHGCGALGFDGVLLDFRVLAVNVFGAFETPTKIGLLSKIHFSRL